MNLFEQILAYDQTVRHAVDRHPRLKEYVYHYLNRNHTNSTMYPYMVPILSVTLAPALLAYHAYMGEQEVFYKKGTFTWKTRHINKNIVPKLGDLMAIIEEILPAINVSPTGPFFSNIRESIKTKVHEAITNFRRSHKLHHHSFWNLAALYYVALLPEHERLIPDPANFPFLISFNERKVGRLERLLNQTLQTFMRDNEQGNNIEQVPQPEAPPNNDEEPCTATMFANREHFEFDEKNVVFHDLFSHNLGIDFWESNVYWNAQADQFEYLPLMIAQMRIALKSYVSLFKRTRMTGPNDPMTFEDPILYAYRREPVVNIVEALTGPFIDRLFFQLRCIYNIDGSITSMGHVMLERIRIFRQRHGPDTTYVADGVNLWNFMRQQNQQNQPT